MRGTAAHAVADFSAIERHLPADNGVDRPAGEFAPVKRRPAHLGKHFFIAYRPGVLDVHEREVGVPAFENLALVAECGRPRPGRDTSISGFPRACSVPPSSPSASAAARFRLPACRTAIADRACCFSSSVCGAWSVAMKSIMPSCSPAQSAALSSGRRIGGFICTSAPSRA